jgi:hypothetical protein
MNNAIEAIYLIEFQELLLGNGQCVKVPQQIATTVSPRLLDLRFVKRWAIRMNHVTENADIGVTI